MDKHVNMSNHVNGTCTEIRLSLKFIGRIRKYLSQESVKKLVNALVSIDYVNSLLYKAPKIEVDKLQTAMNSTAQLIAGIKKSDHIIEVLKD